jgi:hypothetical protein
MKNLARAIFALGLILAGVALFGHFAAKRPATGGNTVAFSPVFRANGVRIFPYNPAKEPMSAKGLTGTAKFLKAGTDKPIEVPLVYIGADPGAPGSHDGLDATLDLAGVDSGTITFDVAGFTEGTEPRITFTVPFKRNTPAKPR